ncbi:PBP1A family penicillin-binding protein [Peribacillus cavernae]|uniref:PBP1A family penicillin-binding protein n=1 Tax=Peribacillus cavernae TaxID=1674310 RepID=A0A3S0WAU6_9BACI|nr:PBP1A family penicillin-binding protein [Peribacillus cavernae]MDQ0218549.1 1A family penicillin-binding protein [Peribacillus cavernae]RUQ31539.1 PBP1A family penicillin-binding protein [Peribacillus cavernae]
MELITGQRFKRTSKYIRAVIILTGLAVLLVFLLFASLVLFSKVLGAPPLAVPQSTLFYSDDGEVIGENDNGQKRYWVNLADISPALIDATIAVEDRQFYTHNGFDLKRIAGAVVADIRAMSKVQGASTITQQYARNLYLGHDKTWNRKFNEAFYTIRLETNYSKKEILEGYLNTIYYGHGAYGIQAASQYYFGKDAKDLTVSEASMLAGIPKGPSSYSPFLYMEHAKKRQKVVLLAMANEGMIPEKMVNKEIGRQLVFNRGHKTSDRKAAPYFQDAVKQALKTQLHLDESTVEMGGLKVYTTLDTKEQEIAEKTFSDVITETSEIQAALVAMNPKTGEVKALVGGRDYELTPYNRAIQAIRQPGSTIKPLLYYAALEKGFTPSSTLKSELTTFSYDNGKSSYTPHNFNHQYADSEITMAQAIALSDNVYAVKTHLFLGEKALIDTVRRFGLETKMAHVPSLALGTSGVRVIEMVNAYSMLANGGKEVKPVFIKKVENHKGEVIFEQQTENKQILDPAPAYVMTQMLTGIFDKKLNGYTKVTGSSIASQLTRKYAGKSGTTETDSWMIGYTPQLVTGVWAGYDNPKNIAVPAEKRYAKDIWAQFMENSLEDKPEKKFKESKNVVGVYVNPENGKLATEYCPVKRLTYYVKGTEPTEVCTEHLAESKPHKKAPKKSENGTWYKRLLNLWGD